ncbi:phosphatidylinositol-3,5-bisphosphate 5-phosphatase [Coemansia sp. RSA 1646]|nr:phosphatidylinositol-3,5-bisphosphate 5-phosphatase [Coemansia sp. RSA 1646]
MIRNIYRGNGAWNWFSQWLAELAEIRQGLSQGDPLPPLLYNTMAEPLLPYFLRNINGLHLSGHNFRTIAFTDDVAIIVSSEANMASGLSIFGRDIYITLIVLRSCIFAGVRYLKRGVNDAGYVANDVETEQIVNTMEVASFNMPFSRPFSNPRYTAYEQHRGLIPLFWSQDTLGIARKPPIDINIYDPYSVEAGRHFDNLLHLHGTPIIVLNPIKIKACAKREWALGEEFSEGLHYLSQFLPRGKKLRYLAWDMSRNKKNRQEDVLAILSELDEHADPTQVSREEIYNRETPQVFQPLKIGGWTTDGIMSTLQEPSVSQPELDEYEKYVHQFDDLKRWIVPSSDMLYSDYAKNKQDSTLSGHLPGWTMQSSVYPGGNSPTSSKRKDNAVAGSLKTNNLFKPFFAPFDLMPLDSGSSSDGSDSSGSCQQYPRNRSNAPSNERGSLWGLWSQNGASGSFGSGYTLGNRSYAHPMAAKGFLGSRSRVDSLQNHSLNNLNHVRSHDRSQPLDLSNINVSRSSIAETSGLGSSKDTLVPEPRVTAIDLKVYESFKMRQSFGC